MFTLTVMEGETFISLYISKIWMLDLFMFILSAAITVTLFIKAIKFIFNDLGKNK